MFKYSPLIERMKLHKILTYIKCVVTCFGIYGIIIWLY